MANKNMDTNELSEANALQQKNYDERKSLKYIPKRNTLVVNLYAGPSAGKTTCAWLIAGELKKRNIITEYVPEYAKELVWDNKLSLLDGSYENQLLLLKEQSRRIQRLIGKVDVIVTDAPLLLGNMYVRENHSEYYDATFSIYNKHNNFNIFINRGKHFEKEGRIHNLEESIKIDNNIKKFLKQNNIFYGIYQYSTLDVIVNNIITTLSKLQKGIKPYSRADTGRDGIKENAAQDFTDERKSMKDIKSQIEEYRQKRPSEKEENIIINSSREPR